MDNKEEKPFMNKQVGILIILVAIILMVILINTNFLEELATFSENTEETIKIEETEKIENVENSKEEKIEEPKETKEETIVSKVNSTLEVYYLYVGQGDATFIKNGEHTMLIDAGNNPDGKYISKWLRNTLGIKKLDYLIATHGHEDHIGGIDIILQDFEIGTFYMPSKKSDNKTYTDVVDWAKNKNVKILTPAIGTKFDLGEATCEVMSIDNTSDELNENSIVIEMTFGTQKYLFTADMEAVNEESRIWNDVDVLKVSHHGSTYTSTQDFLKQVKPEIAVISCGKNNDYYYPHEAVLKRLQDVGCRDIYITKDDGTILITSDGTTNNVKKLDLDFDGNK